MWRVRCCLFGVRRTLKSLLTPGAGYCGGILSLNCIEASSSLQTFSSGLDCLNLSVVGGSLQKLVCCSIASYRPTTRPAAYPAYRHVDRCAFALLCSATLAEKVDFMHSLFDFGSDGDLSLPEVTILVRTALIACAKVRTPPFVASHVTQAQWVKSIAHRRRAEVAYLCEAEGCITAHRLSFKRPGARIVPCRYNAP